MKRYAVLATVFATTLVMASGHAARSGSAALRNDSVTFETERNLADNAQSVVIEAEPPGPAPSAGAVAPASSGASIASVPTPAAVPSETTTTVTTTVTTTIVPDAGPVASPNLPRHLPGHARTYAGRARNQQFSVHRDGDSWIFTRVAGGPSFNGSLDLAAIHLAPAIASAARAGTVTLYVDGRTLRRPNAPPVVIATGLEGSAPDHPLAGAP